MRRLLSAFALVAVLAAGARAQKTTPPKLAPCDTSSVLAKATPIFDVGAITLGKSCPAFAQAVRTWYAATPAAHQWSAGQVIAALLAEPFALPPKDSTPATPAPPLGADEPTFDAATATMVYSDNMDRYTTAAAMGATGQTQPLITPNPSPLTTSSAVNTTKNQLIVGRGGSGRALRLAFTGETQGSATFLTWNMPKTPMLATHVFQYWARVTLSAPLGSNGTDQTLAVKWFEAWHASGKDRVQWNTHDHLPCPARTQPTYWQVYDQGRETTCQGNQPVGPRFADVADGQWHRFTYSYRPNSAAGARDGFARMWIDGVKIIDVSKAAIGIIPPGAEKPWCLADDVDALAVNDGIDNVWWGSTQTTATVSWAYDIDDYRWWTTIAR